MDWMKIGTAALMIMMVVMIWPRARDMLKNSPKGSNADWMSALIPLGLVILFVLLLVQMV